MTRICLTQLEILSDDALTERLRDVARLEFGATAQLVAHLAEFDARRLYLRAGCASLYIYCTSELHLSEHAAYGRISAARSARRWPLILDYLADGRVTLTAIVLLGPHLSGPNHRELLDAVTHRPRRWIEEWLAERRPAPPVDDRIRRLPDRGGGIAPLPGTGASPGLHFEGLGPGAGAWPRGEAGAEERVNEAPGGDGSLPDDSSNPEAIGRPVPPAGEATELDPPRAAPSAAAPAAAAEAAVDAAAARARHERLSPLDRAVYKVQFTAGAETYRRLMQVRELMRHSVPDGDLGTIFDRALRLLHLELARRKYAFVLGAAKASAAGAVVAGESGASADPALPTAGGPSGRQVPAAVRRTVWRRDGGRCCYTTAAGRRCEARGGLEFHHRHPYARGGPATVENIELRCRAHNLYEDEDLVRRREGEDRGTAR